MKQKLMYLLIVVLAVFNIEKSIAGDNDPKPFPVVVGSDIKEEKPHRGPVCADIYGLFSTSSASLLLFIAEDLEIGIVQVYKDGSLVLSDSTPLLIDGIITYDLSNSGSGTYQIIVSLTDGTEYIGLFVF